ncbi:MAG: amino acid adenylation domain-containing protein [Comamonadaceae bacterium]|nr:MAG: amino acid adenylation domain-containing protein [Comamonadaceae bacterium]
MTMSAEHALVMTPPWPEPQVLELAASAPLTAAQPPGPEWRMPLTVPQRGMWVSQQIGVAGALFNLAECVEIHGAVDVELFMRALYRLADEAEIARARVVDGDEGPMLAIAPRFTREIPCVALDESDPEASLRAWIDADLRESADASTDALWQVALLHTQAGPSFWYHRCHHILIDGFGGGVIARRLADVYTALVEGRDPGPTPFGSLTEVARQEQAYRGSPRFEADRRYWMERLTPLPEPVSLAVHRMPPSGGVLRVSAEVPPAQGRQLRQLARERGGTLPQALIGLVAAYVHRLSGAEDLVFGMPVTGRTTPAMRRIPGMMANAVALRLRITGQSSLADLVGETSRALLGALRHQQYRYEDLRRDLNMVRADQQLSWMAINVEPFDYCLQFGGLSTTTRNLSNGSVDDLAVFIYDRDDDSQPLRIDFDANPALYDAAQLARHRDRLLRLIEGAIAAPGAALADLPLLPLDEQAWLSQVGQGPVVGVSGEPWWRRFEHHAARQPDAVAVVGEAGALTYGELSRRADALAHRMIAAGVQPGDRVAVALPREPALLQALLAVHKCGAAYVPLDLEMPEARRLDILTQARPVLMLVSDAAAAAAVEESRALGIPCWATGGDIEAQHSDGPRLPLPMLAPDPDRAASVIFTSGSTGRPKGVVVREGSLASFLTALPAHLGLGSQDTMLAVASMAFDVAAMELFMPLAVGGRVVIAPSAVVRDPATLARWVRQHGITIMQSTPSQWKLLMEQVPEAFAGVRLLVGGEALAGSLARAMHAAGRGVVNLYGPTETTVCSTWCALESGDLDSPPIGRPIGNTRCHVLDAQLRPSPRGTVGELCIAGEGVAAGYLDLPEMTRQRFVPEPGGTGRMYRTGDLVRWRDDGRLDYLGRTDEQLKIRGFRIEAAEVESALMACGGLRTCAVVALADSQGETRLVAYVVPAALDAPDTQRLRQWLRERLPEAMVPSAVTFLDALPLTTNGKLDRAALPEPCWELTPVSAELVAPRTPTEALLVDLWREVLGTERIGVHDSLFELGGNSLAAARIVGALRSRFAVELPLGAVFSSPTIAGLAEHIDRACAQDPFAECLPLRAEGDDVPLFCLPPVLGLGWGFAGLMRHLPASLPVYVLQAPVLKLDPDAYPATLEALAERMLGQVRQVRPQGPYRLLGWSFGGLVAHAMARQLRAQGETVELLAMMDSYHWADRAPVSDETAQVKAAMAFLGQQTDPDQAEPANLDELAALICRQHDVFSIPMVQDLLVSHPELFDRLRLAVRRHMTLACDYRPEAVDVPLLFLRADRVPGQTDADAIRKLRGDERAWAGFVAGLHVHGVDCTHEAMLGDEALRHIGPLLKRALGGSAA